MQDFNENFELEENATERGMKWLGRVLAIITVLVVCGFGDVMYINLMQAKFPSGLLLVLCYAGAFTSLLAVIYMLIGKSVLFTPGPQMVVAWFVFGVELLLIALNIILVFQGGNAGGFLEVWDQLAPATPVINMAGVAILFFLDESQKMKHEDVELSWDMKRANRKHFKAMARARLKLQTKQLNFLVTELDRAVASPESLAAIQQTAIDLNEHLLGQLSGGRTYARQLPAGAPVPALPSGSDPIPREEQSQTRPVFPGEREKLDERSVEASNGPLAKAKGFLGSLFGSDGKQQEEVTLAQTAPASDQQARTNAAIGAAFGKFNPLAQTTPASDLISSRPTVPQKHTHAFRATPRPVPASSSVAAARRARRAARFHSAPEPVATVATTPAGPEHRTCSECGAVLELKNAKQLTCSPACRKARARRLASEKKRGA